MRIKYKRFILDMDSLFWHCYHDLKMFLQCKMYHEFGADESIWYLWFQVSFISIRFWWINFEEEPMTVGERGAW